jgi:hypothetical protein
MIKIHVHFPSINIKLYVKSLSPKAIKRVWAIYTYENKRCHAKKHEPKKEKNNGHKDARLSETNGYKDTRHRE